MSSSNVQKLLQLSKKVIAMPEQIDGWVPVEALKNMVLASRYNGDIHETAAFETSTAEWKQAFEALQAHSELQALRMQVSRDEWKQFMQLRNTRLEFNSCHDKEDGTFCSDGGSDSAVGWNREDSDNIYWLKGEAHNPEDMGIATSAAKRRLAYDIKGYEISEQDLINAHIPKVATEPSVTLEQYMQMNANVGWDKYEMQKRWQAEYNQSPDGLERVRIFGTLFKKGETIPENTRKELYGAELTFNFTREYYDQSRVKELGTRLDRIIEQNPGGSAAINLKQAFAKEKAFDKDWAETYSSTSAFFRGTSRAELDSYMTNDKIGSSAGAYKFVSVSGDPNIAGQFSEGVVVQYSGNAIRENGQRVQYTGNRAETMAADLKYGYGEVVGKPYNSTYANELEARLARGTAVSDVGIQRIILDTDRYSSAQIKEFTQKYSNITSEIYAMSLKGNLNEALLHPSEARVKI